MEGKIKEEQAEVSLIELKDDDEKEAEKSIAKMETCSSNRSAIKFEDVQSLIPKFHEREDIHRYITNYEHIAEILQLDDRQKIVYAYRLFDGKVQDFLKSRPIAESFKILKEGLVKEFGSVINAAKIHELLSKSFKRQGEKYMSYYYRMTREAARANLEDTSILHYIIKNLKERREVEVWLWEAATLEDLKKKLKILEEKQEEEIPRYQAPRFEVPMYQQRPVGQSFRPLRSPGPPFRPQGPHHDRFQFPFRPHFRTTTYRPWTPRQNFAPRQTFTPRGRGFYQHNFSAPRQTTPLRIEAPSFTPAITYPQFRNSTAARDNLQD